MAVCERADVGEPRTSGAGTCFAFNKAVLGAEMIGLALFDFDGLLLGDWVGEPFTRWGSGDGVDGAPSG